MAAGSRQQIAMMPAVIRAFRGRLGPARALAEQMKAVHPSEPHWYLAIIGSDPSLRGNGSGHARWRSRLDRCGCRTAPAYLESATDNIAYYHRFGFEVTGEITIPGGPTMWAHVAAATIDGGSHDRSVQWRQPR